MRPLRPVALALSLCAAPLAAQETQEERDVGFIQGLIEDNLSGDFVTVRIDDFEGALSSRATVGTLTVADDAGVWLRAEGLVLDWTRSALLSGRLEVTEMSAQSITFVRPPNTQETPEPPAAEAEPFVFALPDLPVAININSILADRITLGEAFLGREYAFSVDGQVSLEDGEGTVDLTAQRLDATVGSFEIAAAYSEEGRILALTMDLQEEAEGIVAKALGIPGRPAVRLLLDGEAPIDDYRADLSIATAGEERIAGNFGFLTVTDANGAQTQDMVLDITGDVSSLIASDYGEFFGTSSRLALQGGRLADGTLTLRALEVDAQAMQLFGSAEIAPDGWPRTLQLEGQIAGPDGTPVLLPGAGPRTFVNSVVLDVGFDADAGDAWEGEFTVMGFAHPTITVPELRLQGGGEIVPARDGAGGRFSVDLAFAADALAPTSRAIADALGQQVTGNVALSRAGDGPIEVTALTVDGPGIELSASGTVAGPLQGFETEIDARLVAAALDRFGRLTGTDLGGAAELDIAATVRPLDGIFDVVLSGGTDDLAVGIEALDPLLAGVGEVNVAAARDTEGTRLETLDIRTDELGLVATADITSASVTADFALDVRNLGLAIAGLNGAAEVRGTAQTGEDGFTLVEARAILPGTGAQITATLPPAANTDTAPLPAEISVNIDVADLAPYAPLAGRALNGALALSVTGTAAMDASTFDLTLTGDSTNLAFGIAQVDPFLTGQAALEGRVLRTAPLSLTVDGFRLTAPALSLTTSAAFTDGVGVANYALLLADVAPALPEVSGALALEGTLVRNASGQIIAASSGTGPGGAVIDVNTDLSADFALAGDGTLHVADLSPYSALAGQDLRGAVDLTFAGSLADITQAASSPFNLVFDLTAQDVVAGPRALNGTFAASGIADRTANGALSLSATATGPAALALSARGTMAPRDAGGGLDGEITLAADDLSVYGPLIDIPLSGALDLSASGTAAPDLSTFNAAFSLAGRNLAGLGYALPGAVAAEGTAERAADGVGRLVAEATGPGSADLAVDATLASAADGGEISGALQAEVADLSPYSDLAGRPLAGALDAELSGSAWPDLSGFDIGFTLTGSDLSAGDVSLPGGLTATGDAVRQSDGRAEINLVANGPGGAAVRLEAVGNDVLAVDASASVNSLSTYAGLIGRPVAGGVEATARGTVALDLSRVDLSLNARTRSVDVGVSAVRPLLAGVGTITAQVSRVGGDLRANAVNVNFPAFSVTGDFDSAGGAGGGTFAARLADVGLFIDTLSGPATAEGSARLRADGGAVLDIRATGPGGITATVLGSVAPSGTLALNVNAQSPLDLANPFIAPLTLSGRGSVALSINGPPALSSVTGTVTLAEGRLFSPRLGTALQDIGGTVQLTGGQAVLQVGAGLEAGGRLTVTGPVGLTGGWNADLSVAAESLVVRDPTLFETTANALISFRGPLTGGALISGTVNIEETEVLVPSSGISILGTLPEVRHVGASPQVRQTLDRAGLTIAGVEASTGDGGTGGTVHSIDITIRAPARIFVRGRGVDAELGGEVTLTGTTAQIIPTGQFELIRGRVDILGQRFTLSEGGAYAQGDLVPYIRLVATTEAADGTEVSIVIDGPADDPDVTFRSSPDLPQDEVLARLLFGRDLSSISPLQAVQLAAAVSTLAGRGGGGLINDFRSGVGLDNLDIVTSDDGGVAVQAGAYISENVYTDVVVGSDNTEVTLNLDLTDDITVTGTAGTDGDTSIGIFFERDY